MPFQLPTHEEKHDYVLEQFERIARHYDITNDAISIFMHRGWKALAVDRLLSKPGSASRSDPEVAAQRLSGKYLDVCCGTGDLALRIASRLRSDGEVVGIDFSKNMLDIARARYDRQHQQKKIACRVTWQQADAQNLPFGDGTFDGAIISFGLRNLTNLERGLREMRRVVRSGGTVVNLDLGKPEGVVFPLLFDLFFSHAVPLIGQVLQNDRQAYTYLPESGRTYPAPAGISELFERAGLKEVRHTPLSCGSVALHTGIVP